MTDDVHRSAIRATRCMNELGEPHRTTSDRCRRCNLDDVGLEDFSRIREAPFQRALDMREVIVRGELAEAEHARREIEAMGRRHGRAATLPEKALASSRA